MVGAEVVDRQAETRRAQRRAARSSAAGSSTIADSVISTVKGGRVRDPAVSASASASAKSGSRSWRGETLNEIAGARPAPLPDETEADRSTTPVADVDDEAGLLGERDELHRRDEAALRVLPARESLEHRDAAAGGLEDGLVVHRPARRGERAAQRPLSTGACGRRGAPLVDGDAAWPAAFAWAIAVSARRGGPRRGRRGRGRGRCRCRRQLELGAVEGERLADARRGRARRRSLASPGRRRRCPGQDGELVAALAGRRCAASSSRERGGRAGGGSRRRPRGRASR